MLVTAKSLLAKANKGNYAVPAFNINNLEVLLSILDACRQTNSPVIIQTTEGAVDYAGMDYLICMVKTAAKKEKFPIALHLDHGKDLKVIKRAINSGYTSVMYDGSSLPFKKNVANTKKVVAMAKKKKITVEAEIGVLAGIEDKVSVHEKNAKFTDPDEAVLFAKLTKCDSLALAIGTSHGAYKFKMGSKLNYEILEEVKERTKMPLVLHGASGIDDEIVKLASKYGAVLKGAQGVSNASIKLAIKHGINKINIDSDLRISFDAGIRKFLKHNPKVFDPRKILNSAMEEMTKTAIKKIKMFGSEGKA